MGCRFIPSDSCPFGSPASSKGWLHRGETGIRGNTWRHLGMGRSPGIQGDDMLRKAVLEKAWGGAGALYADHSRQPS